MSSPAEGDGISRTKCGKVSNRIGHARVTSCPGRVLRAAGPVAEIVGRNVEPVVAGRYCDVGANAVTDISRDDLSHQVERWLMTAEYPVDAPSRKAAAHLVRQGDVSYDKSEPCDDNGKVLSITFAENNPE